MFGAGHSLLSSAVGRVPLILLGCLLGCGSPAPEGDQPPGPDLPGLEELANRMSGSFSSTEQARRDTAFLDIRLRMVPIWPQEDGAFWLYVEQAEADAQDQPYRQRVYRLTAEESGTFRSAIFELPGDPLLYAGEWRAPDPLQDLTPADLMPRKGCDVILRRNRSGDFLGGTTAGACPSTLRGASYATTEVTVYPDRFVSWDRGFDMHGEQVWGSTAGGYEFLKEPG